jgi:hypothetical protein
LMVLTCAMVLLSQREAAEMGASSRRPGFKCSRPEILHARNVQTTGRQWGCDRACGDQGWLLCRACRVKRPGKMVQSSSARKSRPVTPNPRSGLLISRPRVLDKEEEEAVSNAPTLLAPNTRAVALLRLRWVRARRRE